MKPTPRHEYLEQLVEQLNLAIDQDKPYAIQDIQRRLRNIHATQINGEWVILEDEAQRAI